MFSFTAAIKYTCTVPNFFDLEVFVEKAVVKGSDVFSDSDPEAVVTVGFESKRTTKKSNTNNPTWEETLRFECVSPDSPIHIEILDYDEIFEGDDDLLLYADWAEWSTATRYWSDGSRALLKFNNKNRDDASYWVKMSVDYVTSPSFAPSTQEPPTQAPTQEASSQEPSRAPSGMPSQEPSNAPSNSLKETNSSSAASSSQKDSLDNSSSSSEIKAADIAGYIILSLLLLAIFTLCMMRICILTSTNKGWKAEMSMVPNRVHSVAENPLPAASFSSAQSNDQSQVTTSSKEESQ